VWPSHRQGTVIIGVFLPSRMHAAQLSIGTNSTQEAPTTVTYRGDGQPYMAQIFPNAAYSPLALALIPFLR